MIPSGVKSRIWGQDVDFLELIRRHPRFQNRLNTQTGIAITDCDIIIHNYKTEGLTDLRCVQVVEIKSRNGEPDYAQRSAYEIFDAFKGKRKSWLNYGVSFLSYSGETFGTSDRYRWGRFRSGNIIWRPVERESVFDLVAMIKHPDTLTSRKLFKSHHGAVRIAMDTSTALGFKTVQSILKRY